MLGPLWVFQLIFGFVALGFSAYLLNTDQQGLTYTFYDEFGNYYTETLTYTTLVFAYVDAVSSRVTMEG